MGEFICLNRFWLLFLVFVVYFTMEAFRRSGVREPNVPLMDFSVSASGGGVGEKPTDYDYIARLVSERFLGPSHLHALFSSLKAPEPDPDKVILVYLGNRKRGERKVLNVTVALLDAHTEWYAGVSAGYVKDALAEMAVANVDGVKTGVEDVACTAEEVRLVEAVLKPKLAEKARLDCAEKLAASEEAGRADIAAAKAREARECPERGRILQVRLGVLSPVRALTFGRRHGTENADLRLIRVLGHLQKSFVTDDDLRLFRSLPPLQQSYLMELVEKHFVYEHTPEVGTQICANFLDEMPAGTNAGMFRLMTAERGSTYLELMRSKKAADVLNNLASSSDADDVRLARELYGCMHPQAAKRLGKHIKING